MQRCPRTRVTNPQQEELHMNVVVGIFDNDRDMDNAIRQLADQGFEDTVFDQQIIDQEGASGLPPVLPTSGVPPTLITTATSVPRKDQAFKDHLKNEFNLPAKVIDSYAATFLHEAKFVIVRVAKSRAQEVIDIMRASKASRVDEHS